MADALTIINTLPKGLTYNTFCLVLSELVPDMLKASQADFHYFYAIYAPIDTNE